MADEIPEEVTTVFNIAVGYFPMAQSPRSDAVRVLWGSQLFPRFTVDDVCYALAHLAVFIGSDQDPRRLRRREAFPDLAEVIEAADEEKRKREADARPKLEAPAARIKGSILEQLQQFDMHTHTMVGPFESRVREMIAAGVFQGGGAAEAMAKLQPFTYQAAHGVLSRAMSDTPPPTEPVTPERVKDIVDLWEAGAVIDVSEMTAALRTACREEVEHRRMAKEASDGGTDSDRTLETSDAGTAAAGSSEGGGTGSDVD